MSIARTIGLRKITVTVATAGTPVPISPTRLFVTDFEIYVPNTNGGTAMYIGDSTVDSSWIPRGVSESINFTHGTGTFIGPEAVVGFDLSKIFIDTDTNGDGLIVQFYSTDQ